MKTIKLTLAAAMIAGVIGAPAFGQMSDSSMMAKDSMVAKPMKISMADKRMMTKCKGMSEKMMMKNKSCMKMMKMHPDMMHKM